MSPKSKKIFLLYHNARCSKSRACLKIVSKKKILFKEVHYIKEGISLSKLEDIVNNLVSPLGNLVRTNEKDFKSNPFDITNKKLVVAFLNRYPSCLERPLFYNGNNYIICRPPEIVLDHI